MSEHKIEHPDLINELLFRTFIRRHFPDGRKGFVAEDMDLIVRRFGSRYLYDEWGDFALIEIKHGRAPLGKSKLKTFRLIDCALRRGDPNLVRYKGFFVVRTDIDDWDLCHTFDVNHFRLTKEEFVAWLDGRFVVAPLDFREEMEREAGAEGSRTRPGKASRVEATAPTQQKG